MFELLSEDNPDQSKIDVECDLRSYCVIYPFSECLETHRECSIEAYLTERYGIACAGCDPTSFYEFGFKFVCTSEYYNRPFTETMDRDEASEFIPEGARDTVIQIVQACLLALLQAVRPAYVYRVSFTPSAPEKAQRKHALITLAAQAAGYHVVDEGTDSCGRRFWFMAMQPSTLTG